MAVRTQPPPCAVALAVLLTGGCSDGRDCTPDPYYAPVVAPADFTAAVDASLFPLPPGSTWSYAGGAETGEVEVLAETRTVMGVPCTVVHDVVYEDGEVVEDTLDWYAQDALGNVWYFGEDSSEIDAGSVVSKEGSWEAGVDGALPGYVMLADPLAGLRYRQEYAVCEAEDMAEVVAVDQTVTVPAGTFTGCVEFHEWTDLASGSDETKYFCPGVGLVLEIDDEGQRIELTAYSIP